VLATDALAVMDRHPTGYEEDTGDTEKAHSPGHITQRGDEALGPRGLDSGARVDHGGEGELSGE
jgi:hypothetical protein